MRLVTIVVAVLVACAAEKSEMASPPARTTTDNSAPPVGAVPAAETPGGMPSPDNKPKDPGIGGLSGSATGGGSIAQGGDEDPCAGGRVVANSAPPVVTGSLDKDAIQAVVRRSASAMRRCYNAALAKDPTVSRKLKVTFTIATTGDVTDVKLDGPADELDDCIVKAFRNMHFPAPASQVTISYPVVLSGN